MGGICGLIRFQEKTIPAGALARMAGAAAHRGPDGVSSWCGDHAGLGHLALHVTPECVREKLPHVDEQAQVVVTADARIDNRADLERELEIPASPGGSTDVEVIRSAYLRWGVACPARLVGDFAFALWDARRHRLLAARDPMGARPLYYCADSGRFLFASEIKQILAERGARGIYEPAIAAHLSGLAGAADWTVHQGVRQLPSGHALLFDRGGLRTWRFWEFDPRQHRIRYSREDDYVEHFREIFIEAVRCRMRTSKPIGLFLSGGTDSGSVASTAGWLLQHDKEPARPRLHAYRWAFTERPESDERRGSEPILRRYDIPATDVPAEAAWPLHDYPCDGPDADDPFMGPYEGLYNLALREAKEGGTGVMLSGDGGDAAIGGRFYDYSGLLTAGRWARLCFELRSEAAERSTSVHGVLKAYLRMLVHLLPRRRRRWLRRVWPEALAIRPPEWMHPGLAERCDFSELIELSAIDPPFGGSARRQRYHAIFWPIDQKAAVWIERCHARFGLSHAGPFGDRRLVTFVLGAPQSVINLPSQPKRLLRQAMSGIMPEGVRTGSRKVYSHGFYRTALTQNARATVLDLLTASRAEARGYIDAQALRRRYEAFCRGEEDGQGLWEALTLEMWLRRHWSG